MPAPNVYVFKKTLTTTFQQHLQLVIHKDFLDSNMKLFLNSIIKCLVVNPLSDSPQIWRDRSHPHTTPPVFAAHCLIEACDLLGVFNSIKSREMSPLFTASFGCSANNSFSETKPLSSNRRQKITFCTPRGLPSSG